MDSNVLGIWSKVKMAATRAKDAEKVAKLLDAVLLTLSWQQQLVCAAIDTLKPHARGSRSKRSQARKGSK